MWIDPFGAGVAATILAELVLLVAVSLVNGERAGQKKEALFGASWRGVGGDRWALEGPSEVSH